jgi:glucokinase
MSFTIGIDLGGTKIAAGVVDKTGFVVEELVKPTPNVSAKAVIAAIVEACSELMERHEVIGICVAAPGFVDAGRSRLLFTPNLPMTDEPLRAKIEKKLQVPVSIENDANAAAWGELRFGAAQNRRNMVMLTVGTGLGGGLVVDGRLVRGAYGVAAEVGHMTHIPGGLPCGCGLNGCWEQYASGNALVRIGRRLSAENRAAAQDLLALGDGTPEGVEGVHISEAAKAGNEIAVAAFNELGSALGLGMANLSAILDPEIFVIGGGVSAAGEILLAPIRDTYSKNLTARDHRPMPDVVVATLGNDAGMVGAADLARGA